MKILHVPGWVVYASDVFEKFDKEKVGKWIIGFNGWDFAAKICKEAVDTGVVFESKHSDDLKGVCCFYLNGDDIEAHKRVIKYFLDNNLIRKTKTGKLHNIAFKYDEQTRAGEYGEDFQAEIKLDSFLNLETGEWIK